MFCENCGYDFVTGSLPEPDDGAAGGFPPSVLPQSRATPLDVDEDPETDDATAVTTESAAVDVDGASTGAEVARLVIEVASDQEFFDAAVTGGEIEYPTDPAPPQILELAGDELHIGRTSESRAIHPDIDVADLTNDQAVSSRHAVLRIDTTGSVTLTDVGSTNGTFVASVSAEALQPGEAVPVEPGTPFYVGAWTRLTVLADEA